MATITFVKKFLLHAFTEITREENSCDGKKSKVESTINFSMLYYDGPVTKNVFMDDLLHYYKSTGKKCFKNHAKQTLAQNKIEYSSL